MKYASRVLFIALVVALAPGQGAAQVFSALYNFANNGDGQNPQSSLVLFGRTLYGTTYNGGASGNGTIFKVNTDGSEYTNLYSFSAANQNTNSDGANPVAGLVLSGDTLYGAATTAGPFGWGTLFKIKTNGTGFTILHPFSNGSGGANPNSSLVLCSNELYGTVVNGGGNSGNGAVFAIKTDGSSFTNLYNAAATNGQYLMAGLLLSSNTLYGMALQSGAFGYGTAFRLNTDGTCFTNLYNFKGGTNGAYPTGSLILSGNTLYGTTSGIFLGSSGDGTIFRINTDGSCFTNLYFFTGGNDGANPAAGLVLCGNTLYGTAVNAGISGNGTVFSLSTSGADFAVLHSFSYVPGSLTNSDGAMPHSGLVWSGNTLYGTALSGGTFANGTVFALSLGPIPLSLQANGQSLTLTWGNPAFSLQSAPAIVAAWNTVTGATSPYVTASVGPQEYFRLVGTTSP